MNLTQIETFLAVAECGSFSQAGQKLFISGSAVAQQVSSLEESIGARLLVRTTHGVSLTDIGEYVREEGALLIKKDHEMQEQIRAMHFEQENCIVLGTSMWQNCSLFYHFWGKFVADYEQFQIRTVPLGDEFRMHREGRRPNLIESVYDGEPWQTGYSFLHVCEDRIVCAVPKSHPLADCDLLTYESMLPYTLVVGPSTLSENLNRLTDEVMKKVIRVKRAVHYDFPLFTECSLNNWLIQIPEAWAYLFTDFRIIPCEWDYMHPYGFFYREPANRPLELFLDFVRHESEGQIYCPEHAQLCALM